MLYQFIELNRSQIIARCEAKVASRPTPPGAEPGIEHGVPVFLDQLVTALRGDGSPDSSIQNTALKNGHDMQLQGFTVSQVVHGYGDVCQTITEMAVEMGASIGSDDFRRLNGSLDDAIASAVTEYGHDRNQSTVDREAERGGERLAFLAHELRNLTNTAVVAFTVIQSGNVGVSGSTGAVLGRSLKGLSTLIDRALDEVRATRGDPEPSKPQPFLVSEFIEENTETSQMQASAIGVTFLVEPVEDGVMVQADRPVLASILENVMQNAFKFTRPRSTVTLRVVTTPELALIEVEDECGGLRVENPEDLFRLFEQDADNRTGLGVGLAFCRWSIQANHGQVYARSLPGRGCVFTIELPRIPVASAVT